MNTIMSGEFGRSPRWLATDDRAQAAWSLAMEMVTSGRTRSGNRAGDTGVGISSGRALAKIGDRPVWGGADFLTCDAFPARLDPKTGKIYAQEGYDKGDTPGVSPWLLKGDERNVRRAKGIEGVLVRGNQVGENYARAHVWFRNGEIVAHHRPDDPPINSTPVHDPGEGDDDWEAGIHGIMRVRAFPDSFCGGNTVVPGEDKFRAVLLNFTRSGGDNSGRGAATFSDHEGLLSYEAFGPLTYGAPKHRVGEVDGRETRQGAIDCDRALFGDRSDAYTAPLLFEKTAWQEGAARFIVDAHIRMDAAEPHQAHCGPRKGMWKLESRCNWQWLPPTHRRPKEDDPPPDDPGKPRRKPKFPPYTNATIDTPDHRLEDSTVNTPDEIQAPSQYGHAKPDIPDAGEGARGPDDTHEEAVLSVGDPEGMIPTHGYTYEQALRSNVVSHEGFIPQYLYATERTAAGADPNARWPQKTSRPANITLDESTGRVVAYQRGYGPGSKIKISGNAKLWHALAELKLRWPTGQNALDPHSSIIVAGKNTAGTELAGYWGMGLRAKTSILPASGFYIRLDYTDSTTVPHVDIRTTDANGADDAGAGGQELRFNGTALGTGGTGDITSPTNLVAGRVPVATGIKAIDDSDFTMTADGSDVFATNSGDPVGFGAVGLSNVGDVTGVGTLSSGAHTQTIASAASGAKFGVDATKGPWSVTHVKDFLSSGGGAGQTVFDVPLTTNFCGLVHIEFTAVRASGSTRRYSYVADVMVGENGGTCVKDTEAILVNHNVGGLAAAITTAISTTNLRVTLDDGGVACQCQLYATLKHRNITA